MIKLILIILIILISIFVFINMIFKNNIRETLGNNVEIVNGYKPNPNVSSNSKKAIMAIDQNGNELSTYDGPICPYGMTFNKDISYNYIDINKSGMGKCVSLCENGVDSENCIRGVQSKDVDNYTMAPDDSFNIILTQYAIPSNSSLRDDDTGNTYSQYLKSLRENFVFDKLRNNDVISTYVSPGEKFMDISSVGQYIFDNHIKPLVDGYNNKIFKPAFNFYPNFKDSPFSNTKDNNYSKMSWDDVMNIIKNNNRTDLQKIITTDSSENVSGYMSWFNVGDYFARINSTSMTNGKQYKIDTIIYDNEACNCGGNMYLREQILLLGYNHYMKNNNYNTFVSKNIPFKMLASQGVGAIGAQGDKDIDCLNNKCITKGLGEVYWNIGQSFPCLGNSKQYSKYYMQSNNKVIDHVCTTGTSHRAFSLDNDNAPKMYVKYLQDASENSNYSPAPLPEKSYNNGNTIPLFSTESLYSQISNDQRSDVMCPALAFFGDTFPEASDKICGTFDGFSYWKWDNFYKFLKYYVNQYPGMKYVGIYDAMFLPQSWTKNGSWLDGTSDLKLPNATGNGMWPVPCIGDIKFNYIDCILSDIVKCKNNETCTNYIKNYKNNDGTTGYCRTDNYTCHFDLPKD